MAQKKYEPSFDAMIKFFIQKYNLATKQDINRLARKIENLEKTLSKMSGPKKSVSGTRKRQTATEIVLNAVRDKGKDGASVGDIKEHTGYDDKKVRNIVNRLNKEGKIKGNSFRNALSRRSQVKRD